jgi:hypothetical protein
MRWNSSDKTFGQTIWTKKCKMHPKKEKEGPYESERNVYLQALKRRSNIQIGN